MARINVTVPDRQKDWLDKNNHINASGLLQRAIVEQQAVEWQRKNSVTTFLEATNIDGGRCMNCESSITEGVLAADDPIGTNEDGDLEHPCLGPFCDKSCAITLLGKTNQS